MIVAKAAAETHGARFALAMGAIDLNLQHQPKDPVLSPLVAWPWRVRAGVYDGCRLGFTELQKFPGIVIGADLVAADLPHVGDFAPECTVADRVNFHDAGEATVVEAEEFSLANRVASRPGDFSRRLVGHVFFFPRIGNLIDD